MKRDYAKYTDTELLPLLRQKKSKAEAAFTEFYNRYASKVHSYCVCMINDTLEAEDIFQETFIRFFRNINPEHKSTNVKSYLMTTARNLCINHLRSQKPTMPLEAIEQLKAESFSYENKELIEIINNLLNLLDEKYKEAFILREYDGFSYKEIAEILETSLTNAKSRVRRARGKIIEMLEPYIKDIAK